MKTCYQRLLRAGLDEHLDYDHGDVPLSINTRNGSSSKKVKSSYGEMDIGVPRDIGSSFEPMILKKYQKDISNIENKLSQCMQRT